jgi:ribosomal protein L32
MGSPKKSQEQYIEEVRAVGYEPIEEYVGAKKKLRHRCLKCRTVKFDKPSNVLSAKECRVCRSIRIAEKWEGIEEEKRLVICPTCGYQKAQKGICPSCKYKANALLKGVELVGEFKGLSKHTEHVCSCGTPWITKPSFVLSGRVCTTCGFRRAKKMLNSEYENRLLPMDVWAVEEYQGSDEKILHKCKKCGYEWKAKPGQILAGKGCPGCSLTGFRNDLPGILYFLEITHPVQGILYKIGITNRSVKKRFRMVEQATFTVLDEVRFKDGGMCAASEKDWHKRLKKYRYEGPPVLKSGNTELFTSLGGVEYFF